MPKVDNNVLTTTPISVQKSDLSDVMDCLLDNISKRQVNVLRDDIAKIKDLKLAAREAAVAQVIIEKRRLNLLDGLITQTPSKDRGLGLSTSSGRKVHVGP